LRRSRCTFAHYNLCRIHEALRTTPAKITPAMVDAGIAVIEGEFGGLRDPLFRVERPDLVSAIYFAIKKTAASER
jgi:hypothetical protein